MCGKVAPRTTKRHTEKSGRRRARASIVRLDFVRRGGSAGAWLLGGWWVASGWLIAPALAWHLEYFRSPGPQFYRLILWMAPAMVIATLAYAWLRPRRLRKAEPWALAGLALAAPLLWKPLAAATVLALCCAAVAIGRRLLDGTGVACDRLEALALSAGLGFALWIPCSMALGPLAAYWVWIAVALAAGRCGLVATARELLELLQDWSREALFDHPLAGVATALAFPFLAIVLMLALAPAIAHDALMMHLPAALHYLAAGGPEALPHLSHTYFPQGVELLMAAAMGAGGRAAAQLIQPLFFVLWLAALGAVAGRAGVAPAARLTGVLLAATLPFLTWTGGVAKNDMAMALFQTLGLLCLLAAGGTKAKTWLRLGVFFVAASFTVKYTAAFGAAPLAILFLWRWRRLDDRWRELLWWSGLALLIAGAWPLRAYLLTGNPFHPVEISWAFESLRPNSMRPAEWRSVPYWKIPWTVHFDGTVAFESPTPNPIGFLLWLLAPLWALLRRKRASAAEMTCLAFTGIYFFYWGSVWPVVRYAIVPIALLVALSVRRLFAAWERMSSRWRPFLAGLVTLNGLVSLLAASIVSVNAAQFALLAGRIDEADYLRRTLTTYPVLERLAQQHQPGDWTLAIGLTSAAYAPDPSRLHCEYLVDPADAAESVPRLLRQRRYAFLIVPWTLRGRQIVDDLPAGIEAERIYRDDLFSLDRLRYSTAAGEE